MSDEKRLRQVAEKVDKLRVDFSDELCNFYEHSRTFFQSATKMQDVIEQIMDMVDVSGDINSNSNNGHVLEINIPPLPSKSLSPNLIPNASKSKSNGSKSKSNESPKSKSNASKSKSKPNGSPSETDSEMSDSPIKKKIKKKNKKRKRRHYCKYTAEECVLMKILPVLVSTGGFKMTSPINNWIQHHGPGSQPLRECLDALCEAGVTTPESRTNRLSNPIKRLSLKLAGVSNLSPKEKAIMKSAVDDVFDFDFFASVSLKTITPRAINARKRIKRKK
eukprot:974472_1